MFVHSDIIGAGSHILGGAIGSTQRARPREREPIEISSDTLGIATEKSWIAVIAPAMPSAQNMIQKVGRRVMDSFSSASASERQLRRGFAATKSRHCHRMDFEKMVRNS